MKGYIAPLKDMHFVLNELAGLADLSKLPTMQEATPELAEALLESAARFATEVLSPLNSVGDREGVRWTDGEITTATGFKQAYRQFVDDGWNALSGSPAYGGQGLPYVMSAFVEEMWRAANIAFGGCASLTRAAVRAIEANASEDLKRLYLPHLTRGDWTGAMDLTEPHAGSDLSAINMRAERASDGTYRLFGQKIFISWGQHDLSENIIHLVLARTANAPSGVKGLSMFLVPKRLVNDDGTLGPENDIYCVSAEHKLGQHAAPNTVLAYGSKGENAFGGTGAIGYLVGKENFGIQYMFVMMNEARFSVGVEGIGLADRACQSAISYAHERIQGSEAGVRGGGKVPIVRHPDVKRMLLSMRAHTEAARAIAGVVAAAMDVARCHPDDHERAQALAFVDLMTPVFKAWSTESAVEVASTCLQVHGGAGYMEDTGVAQYWRDARIMPIYEGTTGIQASDLALRKIARDGARTIRKVMEQMRATQRALEQSGRMPLAAIAASLGTGLQSLHDAVDFIMETHEADIRSVLAGAVPFLKLFGIMTGGWQLARSALAANTLLERGNGDATFYRAKIQTARFFADHVMSQAEGLAYAIINGADSVLATTEYDL